MAAEELIEVAKELAVRASEDKGEEAPNWQKRFRDQVKRSWRESLESMGLAHHSR